MAWKLNSLGKFINRVGFTYGDLKVTRLISRSSRVGNKKTLWECICKCGAISNYTASNLETGNSTCCLTCRANKGIIHGHAIRENTSPEYRSWQSMRTRCTNENSEVYSYYGGRGITICDRWLASFENFLADMGLRPDISYSLDRIDVNGNYEPTNCRWATRSIQSYNRRKSKSCGVYFRSDTGRWSAYIDYNRRRKNLGCFDSKEEALDKRKEFENLILTGDIF